MELAKLIAPNGPWGKAWLAAHWERKLKKQDYVETDLRSLLNSISRRRSLVSLRATGHLLVGACKIYVKKCSIFEEEAEEVRTALMMAFSRPTDMQAAEELAPIREVRTHTAPPDQALLGGKRHMARIEDITLKDSKEPTVRLEEADDLFGSLSQGELQEVMKVVRKRVLPKGALEALESKTSIADLDFDTMPLVALSDKPQVEEVDDDLQLEGEGDLMPMDLEAALEDEATPAAAHTSPVPMAPQDVDPDDLDHVAGQAAMQLVPFPNPVVARQLLTLGEEERQAVLNFFPTVRREEVQMLIDQAPDPLSTRRGGGGSAGSGRGGAQVPLSYDAAAVVAAPFVRPANFGTLVMSDGGARKKRRTYFLADEVTEIPKETYKGYLNDRTAITNRDNLEYSLLLPHNSPLLPNFTTTFSDVCKTLVEPIILGSEVAEKRRRLYREDEFQGVPGTEKSTDAADEEDGEGLTAEQRRLLRLSVGAKEAPKEATPLAPVLGPMISPERAGLRSPGMIEETPVVTETVLLENAPSSMNAVVTGAMDDEDQSGNARLGYSGRSEKMHRFLAKEFKDTGAADLSYEEMCRNQTRGRRELIAGCFFELLVLKTNGVINLEQANPLCDIKIAKAGQFAK